MRVVVATLRKLIRRPASWVSLGLLAGLLVLIMLLVGATVREMPADAEGRMVSLALLTFPGAYLLILSFILGLGGLLGMIFGAAVAGSEWSWGTLKNAVSRGESRWRYVVSTYVGVVILLGVALLVTYAAGILSALAAGQIAGLTTSGLDDGRILQLLPEQLGRSWLSLAEQGAIGFAIATLTRSQLAGIGAGIGLYFGEQFATIFLPDQVRYLPFHVADRVVDLGGVSTGAQAAADGLSPDLAVLLAAAWMVGALALAAVFTDRAEITG